MHPKATYLVLQVIIETFYHMHILQNEVFTLEHEKASNAETRYLAVGPGVYILQAMHGLILLHGVKLYVYIYYIPGHLRSMTDVVPFSSPGRWIKYSWLHFLCTNGNMLTHSFQMCCMYMHGSAL